MEESDKAVVQDLIDRFYNEADKIVRLLEVLKERVVELAHKGEDIPVAEIKQCVRKKAITELKELTEKLVSINIDLELDYIDSPNLTIPYFQPGEVVNNLKFLSGDNPWCFWLLDGSIDSKGILKDLLHKFQNNMLDHVKYPEAAQSVCFIDRNKVIRGIILQIINENRIKLVDCDSNMTKVVAKDKLYKVDSDACSVRASAIRCTISEEPNSIELWKNSELRDLFCNTLREANLCVKIINRLPGSLPIFVVDIELQSEDEESTANLKEWVLDRLMPEVKKLGDSENSDGDSICDYLSEESLSPYYKSSDKKLISVEVPETCDVDEHNSAEQSEVEINELNNLNLSSNKPSEKFVSQLNLSKEDDNTGQENVNNFENKTSTSSEEGISNSSADDFVTSSSKESLLSDSSNKTESTSNSRLNCNSVEFRPKHKKPEIPRFDKKFQNKKPLLYPAVGLNPPWHYISQPFHNSMPWTLPVAQSPSVFPVKVLNEVNALAEEFIPKTSPQNLVKVECPPETINLRKSATLIKENENFLVMISHVESPSEFYIHFVNKNNKYIDKLTEEMFAYYTGREFSFESCEEARSRLGRYCACKWPQDNHWYRVEVLDWGVGNGNVKVCFVDYGNTECLPLSCLQPLIKKFEKISICAQACHLAKVHPIVKGQPWSEEAINFFKSKAEISNSRMYSIIVVQSNSKAAKQNSFSVLLYEGKATDSTMSINDQLVEQGLAWSRTLLMEQCSSISSDNYQSLDELSDPAITVTQALVAHGDAVENPLSPTLTLPKPQTPPNLNNGLELVEDFEKWDPLTEDYKSERNNPAINMDDACVAVTGYSAKDEARICKFYKRDGYCYKTVCYKEHSRPNPDGVTTDKEEVYVGSFSRLTLPMPGEVVRLKITYVDSINLFYAQIAEKRGIAADEDFEEDAETLTSLQEYMNKPENVSRMRGLSVSPAPGELVLARYHNEETGIDSWFRARVITTSNPNPEDEDPEIMFVDYGSTCTVPERDLRKMEARYLHLPFQAIECSLANIISSERDSESVQRCTELLQEMLTGKVLTAQVYESISVESFSEMLVVLTSSEFGDVGEMLLSNGFAIKKKLDWDKTKNRQRPKYYPG